VIAMDSLEKPPGYRSRRPRVAGRLQHHDPHRCFTLVTDMKLPLIGSGDEITASAMSQLLTRAREEARSSFSDSSSDDLDQGRQPNDRREHHFERTRPGNPRGHQAALPQHLGGASRAVVNEVSIDVERRLNVIALDDGVTVQILSRSVRLAAVMFSDAIAER